MTNTITPQIKNLNDSILEKDKKIKTRQPSPGILKIPPSILSENASTPSLPNSGTQSLPKIDLTTTDRSTIVKNWFCDPTQPI